MYITISIEEGPQYRLGKVDVTGELLASREYFLQRVSVKTGEIFNRSKLSDDLQKLTDYYKDRGYAYVNATPSTPVNEKTRTVDVAFEIQKGPLVTFDRIRIRGNTKTRDKVIRRELRIFEGDTYNQTQLDYSKRRVTALGFFEKVDVSTKRGSSDDKMDVNFEVAERPTGTFQIGAGFSSVENFIAQAQISQNNLLGRGQLLTLQAQLSSLRQLFLLQFQDLYFLDTKWTFGFNLFKQDQFLFSFVAVLEGRVADLGLPDRRGHPPAADLHAGGRRRVDQRVHGPVLQRVAAADADRFDREPAALGDHVVGARVAVVRLARQPHVPDPGLVQHDLRRDRGHVPAVRERLHPLRGGGARLLPDLGAVRAAVEGERGPDRQPRRPRRADLRALLRGRHLRRARLPPRSLGPVIRALSPTGPRTRRSGTSWSAAT